MQCAGVLISDTFCYSPGQQTGVEYFCNNFVRCAPIVIILSLLETRKMWIVQHNLGVLGNIKQLHCTAFLFLVVIGALLT